MYSDYTIFAHLVMMTGRQSELADRKLLQALAAGEMDALAAIYDAYCAPVYHLLRARLGEREQAEELLAEVFLALLDRGRRVNTIRDLRAYLLTIARNKARQAVRRRQRLAREPARPPAEAVTESDPDRKPDTIVVQNALAQLPVEQTEAVVLKIWYEMTFAEIGQILDISPNTAASRYRYGLAKLREILGESNDER